MSGQPPYPRRTVQGASNGTFSTSRYPPARDSLPRPNQAPGSSQPPSQTHQNNPRFAAYGSAPTHGQSTTSSKWQHPAPSTAGPQGHASGTYSAHSSSTGNSQKNGAVGGAGVDDKKRSGSIWERMSSKIGGHDGGAGSPYRERTPLPAYLREP